uniref:Acetyl-coenzyme A synthetase n=1 Tax=Lepeophtheirus salmonis TaxID=72036 RepID=A0A0K2T1Q0_LEPSM
MLSLLRASSNYHKIGLRAISSTGKFTDSFLNSLPKDIKTHEDLYNYSIERPDIFWGNLARDSITWMKNFQTTMDCNMKTASFKWFSDGLLNASVNCVDRHLKNANKTALIWEKDELGEREFVSYAELYKMMNQIANVLRERGVKKGDVVAIYMTNSPLAVASMLACTRIGAIHAVIFAGFSSGAIASRIENCKANVIITVDEGYRGGRVIPLKEVVDEAIKKSSQPIKHVLVAKRSGKGHVKMKSGRDVYLEDAMLQVESECHPESMSSEDPLFYLYTSGSTGAPKGLVHSTAGYLLYTSFTHKIIFDFCEHDIFGCVADIGWITGHSYIVYGPLMNGGTSVLFESTPTYPDPSRYWKLVEELGITQFYTSPTAIRQLMKYEDSYVLNSDKSSLRTLGSVGEPINIEAWNWYNDLVGRNRCDIVDTWWQTETGGICITPRPSELNAEIVPALGMRPFLGINPVLLDDKGNEIKENNKQGSLCLKTPWPGMARSIYDDHKRYQETYFSAFPGYYFTGDGAYRTKEGYISIVGRIDDVINVSGHRLGTAEVEDVLTKHDNIVEAAVVGYPHDIKGEAIYAFVVPKNLDEGVKKFEKGIQKLVKDNISGFAVPEKFQFCEDLPKTRSGKIMRRILRKIAIGDDSFGDISTLANPSIVDKIFKSRV